MAGVTVKHEAVPYGEGEGGGIKHVVNSTVVKCVFVFVCVCECVCVVRLGSSYRHVVEVASENLLVLSQQKIERERAELETVFFLERIDKKRGRRGLRRHVIEAGNLKKK